MPVVSNSAEYRVLFYKRDPSTYARVTPAFLSLDRVKNVGWGNYLNDVPEAFFTLLQDDPAIAQLKPYLGKAHVRVVRVDSAAGDEGHVWGGWLGTEIDERSSDVVIYCHGYLSSLYHLHTGWDQSWTTVNLGTIATDIFNRAKSGIVGTELQGVLLGTVQAPATTSGGITPIILPKYQTYYKRMLFVLRDLSEIGRSDTTNAVVFEITPTGTFNFWGARGADKDLTYSFGTRDLADYRVLRTPIDRVNQVLAVGMSPRDLVLRTEQQNAVGTWGRRQEALLLQWVRDQTELERVAKLRLKKADRDYMKLQLMFLPGAVIPPGHWFSPFILSDRINIRIQRGSTDVNRRMLVSGIQVLFINGLEHTRLTVEDI